jgi:hypothetical protein
VASFRPKGRYRGFGILPSPRGRPCRGCAAPPLCRCLFVFTILQGKERSPRRARPPGTRRGEGEDGTQKKRSGGEAEPFSQSYSSVG